MSESKELSHSSIANMAATLEDMEPVADLIPEYWSPKEIGETRRMVFEEIAPQMVPSYDDPSRMDEVRCALFFYFDPATKLVRKVQNGSKRLVGGLIGVEKGTPMDVKYLGEIRNKTNQNESHNWLVTKLAEKKK